MELAVYTVPSEEERREVRRKYNNTARKEFLMKLAETEVEPLLAAGLHKKDLARMHAGQVPEGWHVHHKLPIHGGGSNDPDNLLLIRKKSHSALHSYLDWEVRGMTQGESRAIELPMPPGAVFAAKPPGLGVSRQLGRIMGADAVPDAVDVETIGPSGRVGARARQRAR